MPSRQDSIRELLNSLPDPGTGELEDQTDEEPEDLESAKGHPPEYYEHLNDLANPKSVKPIEPEASCEKKNAVLNSEMQAALGKAPVSSFMSNSFSFEIKEECLRDSMGNSWWSSKSRFAQCEDGATQKNNPVPCINDSYVKGVQASLEGALHCMRNLPPSTSLLKTMGVSDKYASQRAEMIVSMFKKESGFNVMAKSGTGAMGPAQLTGDAIQQINKDSRQFNYAQLRQYFQGSADPACKSLAGVMAEGKELQKQSCDRVDLKNDNPLKNIIYGIANVLDGEQQISEKLKSGPGKSLLDNLNPVDRGRMLATLSVWTHNTGAGALRRALDQLKDPGALSGMAFDKRIKAVSEALQRGNDLAKVDALEKSKDKKQKLSKKDAAAMRKYIHDAPAEDCAATRSKVAKTRQGQLSRGCEVGLYVPDMMKEYQKLEESHGKCVDYKPKAGPAVGGGRSPVINSSPKKPQTIEDLLGDQ